MLDKLKSFLLYYLATGFGTGFSPIASGTAGSLMGIVLVYFFFPHSWPFQIIFLVLTTAVAINAAGWLAESEGEKDPSIVVADELVGQFATFLFLAPDVVRNWRVLLAGFLLFRIFDIWKPWLIRRAESLPGGWGIVIDDILAGLCSCLILHLGLRFIVG